MAPGTGAALAFAPTMSRCAVLAAITGVSAAILGCGGSTQPPETRRPARTSSERDLASARMQLDEPEESYQGSGVGGLSQDDYESAFAAVEPLVEGCLVEGASRFGGLGGSLRVVLRVDGRGQPLWAYLGDSALGDRDTEKCVLGVFLRRTWPRPLGGDGLAERSFSIDPAEPPGEVSRGQAGAAVSHVRNLASGCRRGVPGKFRATAYVGTDGRVITAGVSPPNERGEEVADCVVDAVKKLRVVVRGDRPAKISFTL